MFESSLASGTIETEVPWTGDFTIEQIKICHWKMLRWHSCHQHITPFYQLVEGWILQCRSTSPSWYCWKLCAELQFHWFCKLWLMKCLLNSIPCVNSKLVLHFMICLNIQ
jgi:hypothetical protein